MITNAFNSIRDYHEEGDTENPFEEISFNSIRDYLILAYLNRFDDNKLTFNSIRDYQAVEVVEEDEVMLFQFYKRLSVQRTVRIGTENGSFNSIRDYHSYALYLT